MSEFCEADCIQFSETENEVLNINPAKEISNEFEVLANGDVPTTNGRV